MLLETQLHLMPNPAEAAVAGERTSYGLEVQLKKYLRCHWDK